MGFLEAPEFLGEFMLSREVSRNLGLVRSTLYPFSSKAGA